MNTPELQGLYLLADESVRPFADWPEVLPDVLRHDVRLVQYRAKSVSPPVRLAHARQLLAWCTARSIPLLINDDIDLALAIGAAGVHLGREDELLQQARQRLGAGALIGASCYDDLRQAHAAVEAGADYISFGRLFPSRTKPQASAARLDTLGAARTALNRPVCAIGGIDAGNAHLVLQAGAQLICVAGGILGTQDPAAAARKLATICSEF